MEIEQEAQAGLLHPPGHGRGLSQTAVTLPAVAALVGRLHENPEPDVIKAVVFEDLQNVLLHPVVAELNAARLGGRDGGNVGADDEVGPVRHRLGGVAGPRGICAAVARPAGREGQDQESVDEPAGGMCCLHGVETCIA